MVRRAFDTGRSPLLETGMASRSGFALHTAQTADNVPRIIPSTGWPPSFRLGGRFPWVAALPQIPHIVRRRGKIKKLLSNF
jgi:hypothetical protein